jgi:hypothetical protein
MNSTSFESRHSPYNASSLATLTQEAEQPRASSSPGLNLTSSPKFSFRAPTAEDFDKGSRLFMEEPARSPVLSMITNLWSKLFSR